jgi:hypothetical protein
MTRGAFCLPRFVRRIIVVRQGRTFGRYLVRDKF